MFHRLTDQHRQQVQQAIVQIEASLPGEVSLEALAEQAGMTSGQLHGDRSRGWSATGELRLDDWFVPVLSNTGRSRSQECYSSYPVRAATPKL